MIFAAIADWADSGDFDVAMMCSWLGVSRAGYYKWRNTRPSTRAVLDAHLSEIIAAVHAAGRGNPGVRRVWAELRARGYRVAKKRVWKLMKAAGLRGRHPKAWKKTTLAAARPVGAPDLIGRDFTAGAPRGHPTRSGVVTSPTSRPGPGGPTSPPSSTCTHDGSSVTPSPTTCAPIWSPTP